jgi:hypothetical protein
MNAIYKDKQWLTAQFSIPGTRIEDVAIRAGCNEKTIRRWQKRLNISSRSMAEQAWLRQAVHGSLTPTAREIIEGSLLGDGNLTSRSKWSAFFQQNSSNRFFLDYVKQQLEEAGVICCALTPTKIGALLKSRAHSSLISLYREWYASGRKSVPPTLRITKRVALLWYLGDGTFCYDSRGYVSRCSLATHSFTLEEVTLLVKKLERFGARVNRKRRLDGGWYFYIRLSTDFLSWIGPCPVTGYEHKWDGQRRLWSKLKGPKPGWKKQRIPSAVERAT